MKVARPRLHLDVEGLRAHRAAQSCQRAIEESTARDDTSPDPDGREAGPQDGEVSALVEKLSVVPSLASLAV